MNNKHVGGSWEELENELIEAGALTQEEIAESHARVAIIGELIKARNEKKISQKQLEELTGIRKSTIARIETRKNSPTIDTMLKILSPLGKTLAVVPMQNVAINPANTQSAQQRFHLR
ncbi:MAG: helix-turn-helix transcriptional regulator [Clostridiales Family XIII bacterium]|jgi:DNA-binding XRE family transcriptional regulator|nr:helix-turn-helix transcriptional regulator [Clostridiales Family XIII bacterium]